MPIETSWLVESKILLHRVKGKVHHAEILATDLLIEAYLDQCDHPVHSIVDRRASSFVPPSAKFVRESMQTLRHRNRGWVLIVSHPHAILDLVLYTMTRFGVSIRRFETMRAACDFLQTQDSSLPYLRCLKLE